MKPIFVNRIMADVLSICTFSPLNLYCVKASRFQTEVAISNKKKKISDKRKLAITIGFNF
jgi:hypothetical protein